MTSPPHLPEPALKDFRFDPFRRYLGITVLLFFQAAALVYQAKHLGLTTDEPSHFAAAYMYWLGNDVLEPSDAPPLTRIVCGWVPRVLGAPDPHSANGWDKRDAVLVGGDILGRPNIRARRLLFFTRIPFAIFPLLIVFLIWHWGAQIFGLSIALVLAICGALEPTVLGHGVIINSDVPAAFAALWFAYTASKYWGAPGIGHFILMTLAILVAVLTKFTLLPLIVAGYGLAIWKGPRLLASIVLPIVLYAGIIAASQFQAQPIPPTESNLIRYAGLPPFAMPAVTLLTYLPWPLQFVRGILYIGGILQGEGITGYMLGHKINGWTPAYFPFAWALKFPIPLQALTLAGLAALVLRIKERRAGAADAIIWGSVTLFFGVAVFSNYHIGFRHVLPALPFFILGGGFAIQRWHSGRLSRTLIAFGIAWLAVSSLRFYPEGLSYFNEWIGRPTNAWKFLADSNVDYGQGWFDLAAYVKRNKIEKIYTFVASSDSAWKDIRYKLVGLPWPADDSPAGLRFQPQPGIYAVGVNVLTGILLPPGHEDYLESFRQRQPDDRAGYSVLIYKIR